MKERVKKTACIALMFILFITSLVACDLPKDIVEKIEGYIVNIIKGESSINIFIGESTDSDISACEKLELSDKVCITDTSGNILSTQTLAQGAKVFFITIDDMLKNAFLPKGVELGNFTHLLVIET